MAFYMEGNDEWQRQQRLRQQGQRQTYFPNVALPTPPRTGAGNPFYATPDQITQQRINAMPRLKRDQLQTYTLPSGGTVTLPSGSRLPPGYTANAATPAEASLIRQQGVAQGYYGTQPSQYPAPIPTAPNQYAGGPYTTQGGVVNPAPTFPNIFQRLGSSLTGASQLGQSLYNLPATQSAISSASNLFSNLYTNLFGSRTTAPTTPAYAYRPPLVLRNQPRSYFDDQNYGY